MRLYPLAGATSHVTAGEVTYKPAGDGGFDFPPDLEAHMRAVAVDGRKQWETAIEKGRRLIAEEAARRADPATLLDAVEQLVKQAEASAPDKPARRPAAKSTAA